MRKFFQLFLILVSIVALLEPVDASAGCRRRCRGFAVSSHGGCFRPCKSRCFRPCRVRVARPCGVGRCGGSFFRFAFFGNSFCGARSAPCNFGPRPCGIGPRPCGSFGGRGIHGMPFPQQQNLGPNQVIPQRTTPNGGPVLIAPQQAARSTQFRRARFF